MFLLVYHVYLYVYLSPYNKVCAVYFHSIDIVKGAEKDRAAWETKCYLPKKLFEPKNTKKRMKKAKFINYGLFKRMIAVKEVVYARHRDMFRLYERYCHQASMRDLYFNDGEDDDSETEDEHPPVVDADDTNEADCDDGF